MFPYITELPFPDPDITAHDGIYSRYLPVLTAGPGRYLVSVDVDHDGKTGRRNDGKTAWKNGGKTAVNGARNGMPGATLAATKNNDPSNPVRNPSRILLHLELKLQRGNFQRSLFFFGRAFLLAESSLKANFS